VRDADIVLICVPHCTIANALAGLAPHVKPETLVGAIPGFGGFGLIARKAMPKVACFFGTQRIPFVVSGHIVGRAVTIGGVRRQTFVATMPAHRAFPVADLVHQTIGVPTVPVSHFFNIELSPSNSIVNPARLYALFGPDAKRPPQATEEFFLNWNLRASNVLLSLDHELQTGRRFIPRDTSFVAPILLQYDANDATTLTKRFRGLHALQRRLVPLRQAGGGYTLDPQTQYLREDIDLGLVLVRDILRLGGAHTPVMDEIIEWRRRLLAKKKLHSRAVHRNPVHAFETIESLAAALD
jgi:hypothetical protein